MVAVSKAWNDAERACSRDALGCGTTGVRSFDSAAACLGWSAGLAHLCVLLLVHMLQNARHQISGHGWWANAHTAPATPCAGGDNSASRRINGCSPFPSDYHQPPPKYVARDCLGTVPTPSAGNARVSDAAMIIVLFHHVCIPGMTRYSSGELHEALHCSHGFVDAQRPQGHVRVR